MKLNYEICLVGEKVTLVPYRPEHVPKYHEWMKDPALLEATGSEPLSLQEEIEMQQSWRDDPDKCTFIVHRTTTRVDSSSSAASFDVKDNLQQMAGDVNLFLSEIEDDEEVDEMYANNSLGESSPQQQPKRRQAEIDIMIAEHDCRGQGMGREASCAMMLYGLEELHIERFFCKINEDNQASIHLFSRMGFRQCGYAACFKQVELELRVESKDDIRDTLTRQGGAYSKLPCPLAAAAAPVNVTTDISNCVKDDNDASTTSLYRYERSPDRGRCLLAATNIQEGQLIFVERPLVALQSFGNVFDGALVCSHCMSFCGSPEQAIRIAADATCLEEITTTPVTTSTTTSSNEHDLIPCRHKCGHVYCSMECQEDDWEWGGHKELCTGWIPDERNDKGEIDDAATSPTHPLLQYKLHARETNEIFLLIATWLVRILLQDVPYHDDDNQHTHPYTDFMMNPWWDVKNQELLYAASTDPGVFAEAASLEKTLKQLCEDAHSYIQESLPEAYSKSPWLTPMGMSRLIGSLEQNCLGIRRKHAVHRNIMLDSDLRKEMHSEIIRCLERAGMIGGEDSDEDEIDPEEQSDGEDRSETSMDATSTDGKEEWDYSLDDIANFLAGFPAHTKVDRDDEWDEVFRPLDGTAHFTVATKMNHSCEPNVILLYKTRGWGKDHPLVAYCVALRDIAEEEELTICYVDANDPVEKRQADLLNYGFTCSCKKCSREQSSENVKRIEGENGKETDVHELFGDDSDKDSADETDSVLNTNDEAILENEESPGDNALLQMAEQIDSVLNKSIHGAIPVSQLAEASNYVVRYASSVLKDRQDRESLQLSSTTENLLKHCIDAIQCRDFSSCRIVGVDLERYLFDTLRKIGSFENHAFRTVYWCAAVTSAIGFSNEGAFLVAMKYLDKGMILGVAREEIPQFSSYVERFASQMARGPCPPATKCVVPDLGEPSFQEVFHGRGLSRPIEFPVSERPLEEIKSQELLTSNGTSGPCVIRKLALEWPSIPKWRDMSTLVRAVGHRLVPIEIGCMAGGMTEKIVSFRHFVDKYLSPSADQDCWSLSDATSPANASKIGYLAQHPLLDQIPALYSDVDRNPCGVQPTNVNIWMGTGGTRTPLHFDSYDNLLVQLVGAKYVRLYSREETTKLYVSSNKTYGLQGNMSDVDCEVDDFGKHPLAKDCPYQEVLLLPGDCLFIPAQHWHYVRSLSTSISVNYWF